MSGRVQVLQWRPLRKGSLIGFANVQFQSGLVFNEVAVHRAGSKEWASPPSRPWLKNNEVVLDMIGKPKWQPIIDFANHGLRSSWSRQIISAVREAHPEAFDDAEVVE